MSCVHENEKVMMMTMMMIMVMMMLMMMMMMMMMVMMMMMIMMMMMMRMVMMRMVMVTMMMRMVMMMMMMQGLHDLAESISSTQVTYHFQCTITPPLIRVAALAPKLNWVRSPGGVVLRSPCIPLQLLIHPWNALQILRGERGQRLGNLGI